MGILTPPNNLEILIRCDGSAQLGLGHIVRCLALACELRDTHDVHIGFATMRSDVAETLITRENFPVFIKPDDFEEAQWIDSLLKDHTPKGLILDIRTQLTASALHSWRNSGITVAVIDDPSDRRKASDLAFYPPVPQMTNADWSTFTGQAFIGWDYILLRKEFSLPRLRPENAIPVLLVTMGGSDPGGLTILSLNALRQLDHEFRVKVVLGRAFMHNEELDHMLPELSDKYEFLKDVTDMPSLMARCDFAIAAFGGTAYELAAVNVPSILLGLTLDHARSAEALDNAGMAINMGYYQHILTENLATTIRSLLKSTHRQLRMSSACNTLDGLGAKRIARIIFERINFHV